MSLQRHEDPRFEPLGSERERVLRSKRPQAEPVGTGESIRLERRRALHEGYLEGCWVVLQFDPAEAQGRRLSEYDTQYG
jgi:hypothetical protein